MDGIQFFISPLEKYYVRYICVVVHWFLRIKRRILEKIYLYKYLSIIFKTI